MLLDIGKLLLISHQVCGETQTLDSITSFPRYLSECRLWGRHVLCYIPAVDFAYSWWYLPYKVLGVKEEGNIFSRCSRTRWGSRKRSEKELLSLLKPTSPFLRSMAAHPSLGMGLWRSRPEGADRWSVGFDWGRGELVGLVSVRGILEHFWKDFLRGGITSFMWGYIHQPCWAPAWGYTLCWMLGTWGWASSILPLGSWWSVGGGVTRRQQGTRGWLALMEDLGRSGQADSGFGARQTWAQIHCFTHSLCDLGQVVFPAPSLSLLIYKMFLWGVPHLGLLLKIQWNVVECLARGLSRNWCLQSFHCL